MVNYSNIIKNTLSNHFNVRDEYKNNTVEENVEICKSDRLPFSVGMINVTGELNIGMALRTASLLGAENFYIFGRKKFDKRSTVGAEKYINIVQFVYDDPLNADKQIANDVEKLSTKHMLVMCETGGASIGTSSFWTHPCAEENHYKNLYNERSPLFLFGSESHGIPQPVLDIPYRLLLSIPQRGVLRSYNVATAMAIVCWDFCKEVHL